MSDRQQQLISVQYLRAIAALLVVLHHARFPQPWLLFNPLAQFNGGSTGVDIFFVISGFIMFTAARTEQVNTFVWRRFTRVAPLYWMATLLMLSIAVVRGTEALTAERMVHVAKSLLFVPHWSIEFPDNIYPYFVPGWTLNYEMFFYGIFALAIAFGRPLLVTSVAIGALVAAGAATAPTTAVGITYTSPQLLQFLAGVWIGYLHSRLPVRRLGWLLPVGFVVIFLVGDRLILRGVCAAAILLGALSLEPSMPRVALLKRLGDASYAVYLFHVPALILMSGVVKRMPVPPGALQFVLMIVGGLVAAAAVGLLLHRYLEKPLLSTLRNPPGRWGIGAACCLAAAAFVVLD